MVYPYLAAFGCALCYGVASVLQSSAARKVRGTNRLDPKGLVTVTTRLPYLLGLGLDGIGWILSLIALQELPLFAVQAIAASSIGVTVLLATKVLHSKPTTAQLAAIGLMFVGLIALSVTAEPGDPEPVGGGFTLGVWIGVGVVAVLGVLLPRLVEGDRAAALLGVVSGLGYGGTAVCARALEAEAGVGEILRDPLTWAIIPYGALGIMFFAAALERGAVAVATAPQFATEAVVPSLIGIAFLGDGARNGRVGLAAAGFVLTVVSAVVLTIVSPPEVTEG
jgi:hypothetical protein